MFGNAFNTVQVDAFADWVVAEVKKSLPPASSVGIKNISDRAQKLNERIAKRTSEFSKSEKLNIYKKARLAARVREAMSAHGYAESFVKAFSFDLLARIAHASKKAAT
jgi:hypothetical protein